MSITTHPKRYQESLIDVSFEYLETEPEQVADIQKLNWASYEAPKLSLVEGDIFWMLERALDAEYAMFQNGRVVLLFRASTQDRTTEDMTFHSQLILTVSKNISVTFSDVRRTLKAYHQMASRSFQLGRIHERRAIIAAQQQRKRQIAKTEISEA